MYITENILALFSIIVNVGNAFYWAQICYYSHDETVLEFIGVLIKVYTNNHIKISITYLFTIVLQICQFLL